MNFKSGDVVALKSGGPEITVEDIDYQNYAVCAWFDKDNNLIKERFQPDMLEKCEESIYSTM